MIVLAVDPGKTTGYVVWSEGEIKAHGQARQQQFLLWAEQVIETYAPWELEVAWEKFIINKSTIIRAADAHWAVAVVGCLKFWCQKHGVRYHEYKASDTKSFATDDKVKAMGWWHPSTGGHANDAARVLLRYLVVDERSRAGVLSKIAL